MSKPTAETPPPAKTFLARYADESARPLTSLVFIVPFLVAYEAGVLALGPTAMRNAVDAWLRRFLDTIGFGQYFLLPILIVVILLSWHHMRRDRWQVSPRMLALMLLEAIALALLLTAQARYLLQVGESPDWIDSLLNTFKRAVAYCGAGVYEELLFRLMLLPAIAGIARLCGAPWKAAWTIGVVFNSLLFSLAHYNFITSGGEPFEVASFVFRTSAGLFFSVLFLFRGFGIAAGSHVIYDVLVGLLRF